MLIACHCMCCFFLGELKSGNGLLKLILWGLKSGNGIVETDLFKS